MQFRPISPRSLGAGATISMILLAMGCASPGTPRPPSLNLPQVVTDLSAQRVGDQVQLHWTTPSSTTDGLSTKGILTAELCRQTGPATHGAPACVPVQRLPVRPGPTQTIDILPQPLTVDPASLLAYRILILNSAGRSAGPSPHAFAAAGAAPPAVTRLSATPTRDGVIIQWNPQSSPFPWQMDLNRTLAVPTASKVAAKPATGQPLPLHFTPTQPAEVHLQTSSSANDPGGTFDRTVRKGETYIYTVQRVRPVVIGAHTLELCGLKSSPITLLLTDTFPPQPPAGLAAVPGGTGPTDLSIDLSWEPGTEADLVGYLVYRHEFTPTGQPKGSVVRLTSSPVSGPAFRDLTATPGHRYAYRVTAVDTAGNESTPSTDVQETLTEP